MSELYRELGISKQAVSQYAGRKARFEELLGGLLADAELLRREHPGCGVEKMYHTLKPGFIGRDRFVELFMGLGFRLKTFKNYRRTTFSVASNYPNLIKGLEVATPCTVWQSDITYIDVSGKFYYAVFLIDVYTKKIVGYEVSDNMRVTANIKALRMALKDHKAPHIHHSDRGSQYVCREYIKLLKQNGCRISMADTAQDNAYAERINRTIKEEYLYYWKPKCFEQLGKSTAKAVRHYNHKRKHNHLGNMSPVQFEKYWENLETKPVMNIFNHQPK